jgi:hypothetical protein
LSGNLSDRSGIIDIFEEGNFFFRPMTNFHNFSIAQNK